MSVLILSLLDYRIFAVRIYWMSTIRINRLHINIDFKLPDNFNRKLPTGGAPGLLLVHLDDIVLLHFQSLWSLVIIDAAAVKQETRSKFILI